MHVCLYLSNFFNVILLETEQDGDEATLIIFVLLASKVSKKKIRSTKTTTKYLYFCNILIIT